MFFHFEKIGKNRKPETNILYVVLSQAETLIYHVNKLIKNLNVC